MPRINNPQLTLLVMLIGMITSSVFASKPASLILNEITVTSPYKLTQEIIAADVLSQPGKELLAFSIDELKNRWLMVYQWDNKKQHYVVSQQTIIPQHFYRFDLSKPQEGQLQKLYFLSSTGLALYQYNDEQRFKPLVEIKSLYLKNKAEYLSRGRFIQALNNDGIDDVVITQFASTAVLTGLKGGGFHQQQLPIAPDVRAFTAGATYTETALYFEDINFDNKVDILSIGDGEMVAHLQSENNLFNKKSINVPINKTISSTEWWKKRDESGEKLDQSNLEYRMLEELKDVDADGIIDMVVRLTKTSGVFDRVNDYEMYLGKKSNGLLSYDIKPDSVISAEGTLTGMTFIDIDNDKKLEVLLAGFDIGVPEIITALVTGGIDQDVYIFKMNDQNKFLKRPVIKKGVELTFSLSSGQTGSAVVKLADLNGDGLKDLVLSNDDDELQIYLGKKLIKHSKKRQRAFEKRSISYDIQLPRNGNVVVVEDFNGDGKEDLLLKYSRLDGEGMNKVFTVIFAQ